MKNLQEGERQIIRNYMDDDTLEDEYYKAMKAVYGEKLNSNTEAHSSIVQNNEATSFFSQPGDEMVLNRFVSTTSSSSSGQGSGRVKDTRYMHRQTQTKVYKKPHDFDLYLV